MITGAILTLLAWVATSVLGILPHIDVPSWMTTDGPVGTVFQAAGSMGVWFPVTLVMTVLLSVTTIWAAGFTIKVARMLVSLFTGGGGGAA